MYFFLNFCSIERPILEVEVKVGTPGIRSFAICKFPKSRKECQGQVNKTALKKRVSHLEKLSSHLKIFN